VHPDSPHPVLPDIFSSSMDVFYAPHVYITEEKWDPEPWSDLESNSGSNSEECSRKDVFAPKMLRRHCLGKTKSYVKMASLESSVSTAASCNDCPDSAEEDCAIQEGQVHQSSFRVSKKCLRPAKRKREMFRKFVDTLKQRMWAEGPDFDLANVELPCSYRRDEIQKILESSTSTHASCIDSADSAEEDCAIQEGQVHQSSFKVSKCSYKYDETQKIVESSASTPASCNDCADSAEEDCAIQEGQVHQSSFKVSKQYSRPTKGQREMFRKFVDTLIQRMWAEGSDFDLANVEIPCSYKRDKIQKILDTVQHGLHVAHDG